MNSRSTAVTSLTVAALLAAAPGRGRLFAQNSVQKPAAQGPKLATSTMGAEVVYITQYHGVQPASITRPAGPFLLLIENRTLLPVLNLSVASVLPNAAAVAAAALTGRTQKFVLDLPPGKYAIAESSRSDWKISLEIQ